MILPLLVPQSAVLLYLPEGDSYPALADYLSGQKIRLIQVVPERGGETLSSLLGLEQQKRSFPCRLPKEPVLVLFGIGNQQADKLLAFLRNHRQISLKAMATPANLKWSFAKLAEELSKEHQQMNH